MDDNEASAKDTTPERRSWLDDRRNVDRLAWALYAVCAVLLAIDILFPKHGPFAIEHVFGFYGLFALVVSGALILAAKGLRVILSRPETYYDR